MKLYVPHPGHFEGLKELIAGSDDIYGVYMAGSPDYVGTGRVNLHSPTIEDIAQQVKYAHKHGVKFEIVINSSCLGGRHLTPQGFNMIYWYFEQLDNIGVDSITAAEPYLIEMLARNFDMEVVTSVLSFVDSPQKAEFYTELGADTIVIDSNVNRHFDVLESIKEATDCELKLLVNEGCLYRCPLRISHFNFFSHANGPQPRPQVQDDYYYAKCQSMRIHEPELIIKSPWIRPEDLEQYEHITDIFKIGGRSHFTNWILNVTNAYANRSYDGNLMDLLDCPNELKTLFYIDNKQFDGVLKKQWNGCQKVCHRCGFCKQLASKVTQVASMMGTPDAGLVGFADIKADTATSDIPDTGKNKRK